MLQATRKWVSRCLVHPQALSLTCGAAAGTAWVAVSAAYWTAFEPVPAARFTFALVWAMVLSIVSTARVSRWLNQIPLFWRVGVASCGLAVWPTLWQAVLARRELIPLDWYATAGTSMAAMAIPALLVILPAVVCGCLLCPAPPADDAQSNGAISRSFWGGAALSWAVLPTTVFVRWDADQILMGLAACLLLGAGVSLVWRSGGFANDVPVSGTEPLVVEATKSSDDSRLVTLATCVGAVLIGFSLEAANRTAEQLVIESLPLKWMGWAGFVLGAIAALGLGRGVAETRGRTHKALLLTAVAALSVPAMFPVWIRVGIWSSARLSALPMILAAKGMIIAGVLVPLGVAAGSIVGASRWRGWTVLLIGAGVALNTLWVGALAGTQLAVCCLAVGMSLLLWPVESWKRLSVRRGWNSTSLRLATSLCLVAVAATCQGWLDPARSANLLFNGEAFLAAGNGHDLATIEHADRTRWLKTVEGQNGVWTLWRQRGNQLLVRRNGVPTGQISIDTNLGPQNFWSIMTAAVPAVLHPQADDILCIGTPGIVEINTLLGFPVKSLTCVEADRETRELLAYQAALTGATSRLSDGRLEWVNASPMQFAGSAVERTYDLIVCPEASAVPLRSQASHTREFHSRIARHLKDGGLFCQRMNIFDFGATPLLETLASLRAAFSQTVIVTTDGSEILLLASNSTETILDPGFVTRLDTPQVRQLCSTLGADWSVMSQLACVKAEHVAELLAGQAGPGNSCKSARFTMRLASETLRWGPKWKEKQALLANRAEILLTVAELDEEVEQTVARRIQDSQERIKILTERPDDAWSYRRSLKDALKDRPRTTIQRVNNEIRKTLTEDDKRRKEYLLALGQAVRDETPSAQVIERLETFAAPYDSLMTDFVHFEVAHLLEREGTADSAREYRHWMYCIAYAPDADRSVRPVAAALNVLRRTPEIVSDPAWRWDQYNYLLDVMRTRWAARWHADVPSKYEAADMQCSVEAVMATLSAMDDLHPEAGVERESWTVQRRLWEDSLVNPTRAHQGNGEPRNQMLDTVRQEWQRRNADLAEPK